MLCAHAFTAVCLHAEARRAFWVPFSVVCLSTFLETKVSPLTWSCHLQSASYSLFLPQLRLRLHMCMATSSFFYVCNMYGVVCIWWCVWYMHMDVLMYYPVLICWDGGRRTFGVSTTHLPVFPSSEVSY